MSEKQRELQGRVCKQANIYKHLYDPSIQKNFQFYQLSTYLIEKSRLKSKSIFYELEDNSGKLIANQVRGSKSKKFSKSAPK